MNERGSCAARREWRCHCYARAACSDYLRCDRRRNCLRRTYRMAERSERHRDRVGLRCHWRMAECPELPSLGSRDMSDGVCCPQLRMGTRGTSAGAAAPNAAVDIDVAAISPTIELDGMRDGGRGRAYRSELCAEVACDQAIWSERTEDAINFVRFGTSSSGCEPRPANGGGARAGSEPCDGHGDAAGGA
jgi:hypothetical protein